MNGQEYPLYEGDGMVRNLFVFVGDCLAQRLFAGYALGPPCRMVFPAAGVNPTVFSRPPAAETAACVLCFPVFSGEC